MYTTLDANYTKRRIVPFVFTSCVFFNNLMTSNSQNTITSINENSRKHAEKNNINTHRETINIIYVEVELGKLEKLYKMKY